MPVPKKKTSYGFGSAGYDELLEEFADVADDWDENAALERLLEFITGTSDVNPELGPVDMEFGGSPIVERHHPNRGWPAGGTLNPNDITPGPKAHSSGNGSVEQPATTAKKVIKTMLDLLTQ